MKRAITVFPVPHSRSRRIGTLEPREAMQFAERRVNAALS
jgi:hypothetical protein